MLTPDELQELESTLLPALERHHLRLLAHGLRTLQRIAPTAVEPPDIARIQAWVLQQEPIDADPAFAAAFSEQLSSVVRQLQQIAGPGRAPLSLDLADLIAWARAQADQRIQAAEAPSAGAAAADPLA
ncbi:MAG: hypothetical protein ACKOXO_03505 [Cyanobium sp.]